MKFIQWLKDSDKKYPLQWTVFPLIIIITLGLILATSRKNKLNKKSIVVVGQIYKVTHGRVYYKFPYNSMVYEDVDNFNPGHNYYTGKQNYIPVVNEKLLIRFYPLDPKVNQRISKYGLELDTLEYGQIITSIKLDTLNVWDVDAKF